MVSRTRSRDAKSGDVTAHADEVSSADQPRPTARKGRAAARPLEAIAEDQARQSPRPSVEAGLATDAGLLDRLAEGMFAALDSAFGAGAAAGSGDDGSSGGEESEGGGSDGEDDRVPRSLRWRPDLTLPTEPDLRREQAPAGLASSSGAFAKQMHVPSKDQGAAARAARKASPDTAGRGWFDLPATEITPAVKADLRMLRLRGAFDTKTFYKKADSTKFPKYFQMGTVVEGAADFYSGRLTKKQRKATFAEEVGADPTLAAVRKRRYNTMQAAHAATTSKGRKLARKTDRERQQKKPKKPKH